MSKASTRRRNKITLTLGAFTMITFGGVYGLIARNAPIDQSATVAVVAATSDASITALVLTDPTVAASPAPSTAPTVAAGAATAVADTPAPAAVPTAVPTAEPTAVPTAQPMVSKVDTSTRAS